jgi:putative glutamine amidotransferase
LEYGEAQHETVELLDDDRFQFEKVLIREWIEKTDKPLLGICLGSQWINVATGGTLIQDIPSERNVNHRDTEHPVTLEPDSRLARILGSNEVQVNSFHHQAADTIGEGLRAVAKSPEGIVEATETTDPDRFLIGVQWHPEKMMPENGTQAKLFEAFIEAATEKD